MSNIKMQYWIPLLLLLVACNDPTISKRPIIKSCDKEEAAGFILECAKNANPMSDEEGEDLVLQCEQTSKFLFCENEMKLQVFDRYDYISCEDVVSEDHKEACSEAGFVYNRGESNGPST